MEMFYVGFACGAISVLTGTLVGAIACWQIVKATHRYHGLIAVPKWALGIETNDGQSSAEVR